MPLAVTENVTESPAHLVAKTGCALIVGGVFAVTTALPEEVPVQFASDGGKHVARGRGGKEVAPG